jgi:Tol biopolymer transport system component
MVTACRAARSIFALALIFAPSPGGKKLVFSLGALGYSGIATYDATTKEIDLLIAPGKDPRWSPDGKYIAFIRDCRALRLEVFNAKLGKIHRRPPADQELWIMRADGTEPRRLAPGAWPFWSSDSTRIYYTSTQHNSLYWISPTDLNPMPTFIAPCPHSCASVSPDGHYVAYVEYPLLKVVDLTTRVSVAEWSLPLLSLFYQSGPGWSPAGDELCIGGGGLEKNRGLWVCRLDGSEPVKVLCGQIGAAWSPDGAKLAIHVAPPGEIWTGDLDPGCSVVETLGPGRTLDEHYREMVAFYTRRIEANPTDANNYLRRAGAYHFLRQEVQVNNDMRLYRSTLDQQTYSLLNTHAADADLSFGVPKNLGPEINTMDLEATCCLSPNGNEFYFARRGDLWVARRETRDSEWGPSSKLGPIVNSPWDDATPSIPSDGLSLYFDSDRPGGQGGLDLWVTTHSTMEGDWGMPVNLGATINSASDDYGPNISADGLELYFASDRPGGSGQVDLWITTRTNVDDNWSIPTNLGAVINSPARECYPAISPDGLLLIFNSNRPGGYGSGNGLYDLYYAKRVTAKDPWSSTINLGSPVNSIYVDGCPYISSDGSTLYFTSFGRPAGFGYVDIWQATIIHINDFYNNSKIKKEQD